MATSKTPSRPTSVKVGYIDFSIRYLEDEAWKADPSLGDGDGGQCDGAGAVISVRQAEGQHDIHTKEILLHEVLHACFYASGIIARVAPVLLDTMRSNPEFTKFLES